MQDFPVIDETTVAEPIAAATEDRAEIRDGRMLVEYSRTAAALADLRSKYAGAKYDLTTTAGDRAARAARLELVTLRTTLEKKRKQFKAPALEFSRLIDAEAKRLTDEIAALETPIDAQIRADEERRAAEKAEAAQLERDRKAKHEAGLATIRGYVQRAQSLTSERIGSGIAALDAMQFGAEWDEYQPQAEQARDEAAAALRTLQAEVKAREDEAARLEAMRAEQNRIAAEQRAEAARLAAEAAALKRQADELAAQRAEAERQAEYRHQQGLQTAQIIQNAQEVVVLADAPAVCASSEPEASNGSPSGEAGPAAQEVMRAADPTQAAAAPTIKLGDLNAMFGFTMTAEFVVDRLRIARVPDPKGRAVMFKQTDVPAICDALIAHVSVKRELAEEQR